MYTYSAEWFSCQPIWIRSPINEWASDYPTRKIYVKFSPLWMFFK